MNWRRWHKGTSAYLVRVVIVMLAATWLGSLLLPFGWDYVYAGGNLSITRTLQPSSADTYNNQKLPTTNYGSDTPMLINNKANFLARSLVQFNISSIPSGSSVSSSTLQLYLSTAPGTTRTEGAHRITSSWSESTVTWSTAPTFDVTATNTNATGTTSDVWLSWTVTPDVSAYVSGSATNHGWMIIDNAEGTGSNEIAYYDTRENVTTVNCPKLSITFTAPWDSHADQARADPAEDIFSDPNHTVYMKGTGFATDNYSVGYYDHDGTWTATDENIIVGGDGILNSEYLLTTDPGATPGTWHALVQPASGYTAFDAPYSTIVGDPDTYGLLANDSFDAQQSAIPEFPTVMAGIMVTGLCFGIYYWMRRRKLAYVKA